MPWWTGLIVDCLVRVSNALPVALKVPVLAQLNTKLVDSLVRRMKKNS